MRVDITLGVPRPPDDGDDPLDGIIAGSTLGAMLARMAFDYPDQMLARIKTDHGDGTYTCDRPGTNILMKMVPSNSPELAEQLAVGMTVVIKFYNRDRKRPYIVRIAGGLGTVSHVWRQGEGDPSCIFAFRSSRSVWPTGTFSTVTRADCQTLGIVIVEDALYWLYATIFSEYVLEALSLDGSTLWTTTLGSVASLARLDLCWGYLFYDPLNESLAVLSPESDKRGWRVSLDGEVLSTTTFAYLLSQCGFYGGWIVKGWHYQNSVDAGNGNGQEDAQIRGLALNGSSAWAYNPTLTIPAIITERTHLISSGRVYNPFGFSSAALLEGRWPITAAGVAVHVAGWQGLEDSDSSRMIDNSPETFTCVTQVSLNSNAGRKCWASAVMLSIESGSQAWCYSKLLQAATELRVDTTSRAYWTTALTALPGRAILLDSKFARDLGSSTPPDYVTIRGLYTYAGVAETLSLDRTASFAYNEYITGNPADGTESRTGKYQHSIGTPLVFGDPVPRASTLARPEREYFHVPHVRLLPRTACHMERGSSLYPDGEDIVDGTEGSGDARGDAPHQVVIDDDGRVYRCVQRPVPTAIGGPFCLPEFDSDQEITGSIIIGYDDLGQPITTTTQGWQKTWSVWQVGEMKQSWATWMECYSADGSLEWEEDISYYFTPTYRGARTS